MSIPSSYIQSEKFDVFRLVMPIVYRRIDWPEELSRRKVPYIDDGEDKHRLNLFFPEGRDWPVVVFIHGGGWTSGDRNLEVGGEDVYGNIGRYFATNGIGCAVISYRLLTDVHWRGQFEDVASAVSWVQKSIGRFGGNGHDIFVVGHSAGAHLAARVALDRDLLTSAGGDPDAVQGVIAVSGAGFDFEDQETYQLGADFSYLAERFGMHSPQDVWMSEASVIQLVGELGPPFLFLYGGREEPGYRRQAELLMKALRRKGRDAEVVVVPGQTHKRMVLALSRDDQIVGPRCVNFVRSLSALRNG